MHFGAKFHAGRPAHLGDHAVDKKNKTSGLKHKSFRKLSFSGRLKNLKPNKFNFRCFWFRGIICGGHGPTDSPRICDFDFFPVKLYFWNSVTAARLRPPKLSRHLPPMVYWNDATVLVSVCCEIHYISYFILYFNRDFSSYAVSHVIISLVRQLRIGCFFGGVVILCTVFVGH